SLRRAEERRLAQLRTGRRLCTRRSHRCRRGRAPDQADDYRHRQRPPDRRRSRISAKGGAPGGRCTARLTAVTAGCGPGAWMRIAAPFLMLVLLAGCGAESGLPPLPSDQVRARFPPGGVVNSIEIDAVNRLPLRTAELVAPDGQATPASYLH